MWEETPHCPSDPPPPPFLPPFPQNLYMRGVFEEETRPNLARRMVDLMAGATSGLLTVNDKKLQAPMRVRLMLEGGGVMES